jgi:hypothetical protein
MIVELTTDTVRFQDGNNGRLTYQSTLFPAPATKREELSIFTKESAVRRLTFPVDP